MDRSALCASLLSIESAWASYLSHVKGARGAKLTGMALRCFTTARFQPGEIAEDTPFALRTMPLCSASLSLH
jgi:hypothetical protein